MRYSVRIRTNKETNNMTPQYKSGQMIVAKTQSSYPIVARIVKDGFITSAAIKGKLPFEYVPTITYLADVIGLWGGWGEGTTATYIYQDEIIGYVVQPIEGDVQ